MQNFPRAVPPRPTAIFRMSYTCLSRLRLTRILHNVRSFLNHWSMQIIF